MRRLLWVIQLLFTLSLVPGCAKSPLEQATPGATTVEELKARLGEPSRVTVPEVRTQAQLLAYPDGCSYQVERGVVVATTCPVEGDERLLQHWRHRWQEHAVRLETVDGPADPHGKRLRKLVSDHERMAVIYDEASSRVIQVVRYGTH